MNAYIASLSSEKLRRAATIKRQIATLEKRLERVLGSPAQFSGPGAGAPGRKRKVRISAAGRARIAAAQRARWAKVRGEAVARKPRRRMSAAARKKMAAIAKARWAKAKAAGRSTL